MQEILKSTLLDFEKSFCYINFMKHSSGEKFISIEQTMVRSYKKQKVSFKLSNLRELITVLENFESENFKPDLFDPSRYFSKEQLNSILNIYFKGVPVKGVALKFDCSEEMIEKVLICKEIEITDDKELRKAEMVRLSKLKY